MTIANQTDIPDRTIKGWIEESNLKRPPIKARKGRPRQHSDEVRERCLKLVAEGQKPNQIELVEDVSADTIRRWWKEAKEADGQTGDS